jgi:hypothetical protein
MDPQAFAIIYCLHIRKEKKKSKIFQETAALYHDVVPLNIVVRAVATRILQGVELAGENAER